jgi:hypothetical protein
MDSQITTYGTRLCHYCGTEAQLSIGGVDIGGRYVSTSAFCQHCGAVFKVVSIGFYQERWRLACDIFDREGEERAKVDMIRVSNGLSTLDEDIGYCNGSLLKPSP